MVKFSELPYTNPYIMDNTEGYRQTITPGVNSVVYLDLPAEGKDAVLKFFFS
jgi:tryptophan synthase alpha subunit